MGNQESRMEWINPVHGRDQCQGLVNTVIHLLVPLNAGRFVT